MAHFYGDLQGNRGQATRMGTPNSGINGHIRGWHVGVKIRGTVNQNGDDEFEVWLTSGSSGGTSRLIGTFTANDINRVVG